MAETTSAPLPPTTATTSTPAAADAANPAMTANADFMQFIPLIAIFAIFYFLIIRPQQKRMKEHMLLINALKKGDRIVTGGGIIGTVVSAPEGASEIIVDLSDNVRVNVLRATVSNLVTPPANE
ncbi:MAG TPA: preprotein translocase subunit YajC, partial [Alphaproteobacteria bacterium]|nr:preprotein translocase subunit YajC [Alphaproteobacteria bacterium]